MKRKASAVWTGGIKDGRGKISTDSGVLRDTQCRFATSPASTCATAFWRWRRRPPLRMAK